MYPTTRTRPWELSDDLWLRAYTRVYVGRGIRTPGGAYENTFEDRTDVLRSELLSFPPGPLEKDFGIVKDLNRDISEGKDRNLNETL